MALLTWGCRCTLLPAANTSRRNVGEEWHKPCMSAFGWCHTCKSPQEKSEISHQSGGVLDMGKTTFKLSISFEDRKV